jgi:hypothetical protein
MPKHMLTQTFRSADGSENRCAKPTEHNIGKAQGTSVATEIYELETSFRSRTQNQNTRRNIKLTIIRAKLVINRSHND